MAGEPLGSQADQPTELVLVPPPESAGTHGGLTSLFPLVGSLGSLLLASAMLGSTTGGRWHVVVAVGSGVLVLLGLLIVLGERRRWRARAVTGPRAAYVRYLADVTQTARDSAARQRVLLMRQHPHPASLPALVEEGSRVWAGGDDLVVRYGLRDQPPTLTLIPPSADPLRPADPDLAAAVTRLLAAHAVQPDLPAVIDLRSVDRIEVCGNAEAAHGFVRALVCSAAVTYGAGSVSVGVLASPDHLARWDWVKWLPHAWSRKACDGTGAGLMVCGDPAAFGSLLPDAGQVLVVADCDVPPPRRPATTVLWICRDDEGRTPASGLRVVLVDDRRLAEGVPAIVERRGEAPCLVSVDHCSAATAEAVARRLSRRAPPLPASGLEPAGLLPLLGIRDARRLDVPALWSGRTASERLRVPIGWDDRGDPLVLDLKEAAEHGVGPHGLVVGATGSGKSELLRTLVLGLALTHSPDQLAVVLVDFKGGATFAGLSGLPHLSGLVTNLADELALVDRMQEVLSGELVRRQELLRAAAVGSLREHEIARTAGADLAPVPTLLVVVDEFSELLSARPELVDVFVAIGRLGRSLGVHLLLASQRLEEGRLRGLESHLSYRIGLRTFSAQESRAVLGVRDAFDLPAVPGLGYLLAGSSSPVRFRAAFVSSPPPVAAPSAAETDTTIQPFLAATQHSAAAEHSADSPGASLLGLAVTSLSGLGRPARRLWLPPLDISQPLDSLMPDLAIEPGRGLVSRSWRAQGGLSLPIGVVDHPREQRHDPLVVRLDDGHVAVVGAPRSGTSTLLRTIVTAVSLTTTPLESQVYILDLGGAFAAYDDLPHLAGRAVRAEPDVVRRIVAEVTEVVDRREAFFQRHGIDSMDAYRSRRALCEADDGYGDVVLVVDGWGGLRAEFEDLEPCLQQLAARGLGHGLHLVAAATRWADFRPAVRDLLTTRIELRLGEPTDSELDRRAASVVPRGRPGRGLVEGPAHVLVALPRIDGSSEAFTMADGVADLLRRVADAWPGPAGPKLRMLPDHVTPEDLLGLAAPETAASSRLLLGLGERAPVCLDPHAEPHWLVLGDGGSGKTAALRCCLREVMRTRSPRQAQVVLLAPRRSLLGEVPDAYLLHDLSSAGLGSSLADLTTYLAGRVPGPDVTPAQLRGRSWWTGAEIFVVVDDHDLAGARGDALLALQPLLPQARDVGLHLVVARRTGGAARTLYEPMLQTLRDLAAPVLLLSGSPDEGPLVGQLRSTPSPPGRGRLVTRERGVEPVQVAWHDPAT